MLNDLPGRSSSQQGPGEASLAVWAPLLREALEREGCFHWRLRGVSMRPTLPPACEIDIVPLPGQAPPGSLPLGSLIVFASGDALIAHRLVRRAGKRWIAQGDGRLGPDRPLAPDQVLGLVAAAHLAGRRIWPGRAEKMLRWFWVGRHHALRPLRLIWRRLKRQNAGPSDGVRPE